MRLVSSYFYNVFVERSFSVEELVDNNSKTPDINFFIVTALEKLFGTVVGKRTNFGLS